MNTCLEQLQTFSVIQGSIMDRHLGSIEVPAPSIPVIPLVFMSVLIPIYEFIFVPLIRKITHHPSGITQLQRVGVGLVLSAMSMAIAGFVEVKRKNQAIRDPTKPISLFWISFQDDIFGIADMFTLVGLLEVFYKEAPAGMRSLSTSLTWLSLSLGYYLSTVLVDVINGVTKRKGE
jgi:peptide/histidine transporter 3/4